MNDKQMAGVLCFLLVMALPAAVLRTLDDEGCYTEAMKVEGVYYMSCNFLADCGNGGFCTYTFSQVGATYYHSCECDNDGSNPSCQGLMVSNNPDPSAGGNDVRCVEEENACDDGEFCDEEQLTTTLQQLCKCKPN